MLDFDKMTLGELSKVEELTGLSIGALMKPGAPQAKKIAAVALVVKKRRGEAITWPEALELTMPEIQAIFAEGGVAADDAEPADGDDEVEDPKEPSPSPAPRTSRSSSSRSASSRRSTGS